MRDHRWTILVVGLSALAAGVFAEEWPAYNTIEAPETASVELLQPEFAADSVSTDQTQIVPLGHEAAVSRAMALQAEQPIGYSAHRPFVESAPLPPDSSVIDQPFEQATIPPVTLAPELEPYRDRIQGVDEQPLIPVILSPLPNGFEPWWMARIAQPFQSNGRAISVTVDGLTWSALSHSPQVLAMNLGPQIQETEILEEEAAFDWQAFVDSTFNANSDPVGNLLTTGGSPRFRDRIWGQTMGFRRRTTTGGEIDASQRIGYQNNNSRFFVPTQQGTSLLSLSYTQPLLGRSGRIYNTSRIAMAHLDTGIAEDDLAKVLQDHLLRVVKVYWELYRARATLQQRLRLLARAEVVLDLLESRKEIDSQRRQILRAQAAVASRRSEIARAAVSIRNAETQLRFLVNDPELLQGGPSEFLPQEPPATIPVEVSMADSLVTGIQNRPEIAKALKTVRNTSLQMGMAESEYKPALDFVMGTYVSGLEGRSDIPQSFVNQFNQGEPGWSVGFLFDMPLGRRAARANLNRRQIQVQQAMLDFRTSVEMTMMEVEMAVNEVRTTYQEMLSNYHAMQAAETELQFLSERWRLLVGSEQSTTLLLEDVLDAQERVAEEEENFVSAQVGYVMALANLKRAMGVLLIMSNDPNPLPMPVPTEPQVEQPIPPEGNLESIPIPLPAPIAPQPAPNPENGNKLILPPLPSPVTPRPGHTDPPTSSIYKSYRSVSSR